MTTTKATLNRRKTDPGILFVGFKGGLKQK